MGEKLIWVVLFVALGAFVKDTNAQNQANRPPAFDSITVSEDRKITFKVFAPKATTVTLSCGDLPGIGQGQPMAKSDEGVWQFVTEPAPAGAYRYHFHIDGISVVDPRNPKTSESNMNTWSLVIVPGSELFDLRNVPHGAVAQVNYFSKTLNRYRRMHVYTPPGYETSTEKYPVLYLLHGAFDCDHSWSTVGMAGLIMDNLIAAAKAKPMIVVMPAGHTGGFNFGGPRDSFAKQMKEFEDDFTNEIRPHVENRYRTFTDRAHTAIAGLSMGGAHTLDIAFSNLKDYAYIGVFSSGVFGIDQNGNSGEPEWVTAHKANLDDQELKKELKLIWFATGKEDFLLNTSRTTVKTLTDKGFNVVFEETEGGHTWLNWRNYLADFAPKLFQN